MTGKKLVEKKFGKKSVRSGIRTHAHIRGPEASILVIQVRLLALSLAP